MGRAVLTAVFGATERTTTAMTTGVPATNGRRVGREGESR